mmetsp:Transcript_74118/g.239686  ORF Transcript_74118/g.239686 Transcript_74118/m.239686 type:complete len:372 (+) Transcript_74118:301-1416(+)
MRPRRGWGSESGGRGGRLLGRAGAGCGQRRGAAGGLWLQRRLGLDRRCCLRQGLGLLHLRGRRLPGERRPLEALVRQPRCRGQLQRPQLLQLSRGRPHADRPVDGARADRVQQVKLVFGHLPRGAQMHAVEGTLEVDLADPGVMGTEDGGQNRPLQLGHVPDPYVAVGRAGGQEAAILRKLHRPYGAFVAFQVDVPRGPGGPLSTRLEGPQPAAAVLVAGGHDTKLQWMGRDAEHATTLPAWEAAAQAILAVHDAPERDGTVGSHRQGQVWVDQGEGDAMHIALMGFPLLHGRDIVILPQAQHRVHPARDQIPATGECQGPDTLGMLLEYTEACPGVRVPKANRVVIACCRQYGLIGRKLQGPDVGGVCMQ